MHAYDLILTFTSGLGGALILGYLTQRLGLSPIAGYLLAGTLVGPHTPGFVADAALAEQLAEIGVILLMFGVGLPFHIEELLAVRHVAIPGAVAQSGVATLLGALLSRAFGWDWPAALNGARCRQHRGARAGALRQQRSPYPGRAQCGRMAGRRGSGSLPSGAPTPGLPRDTPSRRWSFGAADFMLQLGERRAKPCQDFGAGRRDAVDPGVARPLWIRRAQPSAASHPGEQGIQRPRTEPVAMPVQLLEHPLAIHPLFRGVVQDVNLPERQQKLTNDGISHRHLP